MLHLFGTYLTYKKYYVYNRQPQQFFKGIAYLFELNRQNIKVKPTDK